MGYRDETETLRRRVAELEGELGDARETIGRLTGLERAPETGSTEKKSAILGAPKYVKLERELDLEVTEEGLEAIADLLRRRPDGGTAVSQVGRTLTAAGFSLSQRDGMTQISMTGDYQTVPFASVIGSVIGGGFAGLVTFGIWHDFIARIAEANVLWIAPIFMVMFFMFFRAQLARSVKRRATELQATFEAAVELCKRHRVREAPRVRVEEAAGDEEVEEVEVADREEDRDLARD